MGVKIVKDKSNKDKKQKQIEKQAKDLEAQLLDLQEITAAILEGSAS
ncbi:MAG: hypothetical protein IJT82_03675 [Schwartzia sp.]|nr:hypothetical protein [Schwartzia sp. (in: firmicutes)]